MNDMNINLLLILKYKFRKLFSSYFILFLLFQDAHFSIVRCRVACRCWTVPYDGETPSPDTIINETDVISLASSISSLNIENNNSKKTDYSLNNISNEKQSISLGKNVAISNDSGIHEDGLDVNSHIEFVPKSTEDSFQLPSWLVNNQPIPDELLAKRSTHSTYHHEYNNNNNNDDDYDNPSSFYAFSFIDIPGDHEDTWSIQSLNTSNHHIRDEIKTCVETLHTCLNNFRGMNQQSNEIDENIRNLLNELIDQVENSIERQPSNEIETIDPSLDYNLLNELFTKKLAFNEYLTLLDRLVDNNILKVSSKTGDDLLNEIVLLAEQIEQYRIITSTDHGNNIDADKSYHSQFLSTAQSNYSFISFLQQSTSMDMSLLTPNDLSNQIQSTIFTTSIQQQQQTSIIGGKLADIGMFILDLFLINY